MSTSAPNEFVDLNFTADPSALEDVATETLESTWPEWEPNDADMETIMIESLAPMAASAATQASQMPAAALRAYGTKVLGIAYRSGTPALTTVTIVAIDDTGWPIFAGSQFEVDGFAFETTADSVVPPGSLEVAGVPAQATLPGQDANGLTGDTVAPITMPAYVEAVLVEIPTADGTDAEDDPTYTNRVSRELRLRGFTLVTATDYVVQALDIPGIGRAVCIGNQAREVQVALADASGQPVPEPIKEQYVAAVNENRLINVQVDVEDPTYTEVDVTYHVILWPGYDGPATIAEANTLLEQVLDPANYGRPDSGQSGADWINDPTIRPNWLIGELAAGVVGIRVVDELTIDGAAEDGTLTLDGTFPLPTPGTFTGAAS